MNNPKHKLVSFGYYDHFNDYVYRGEDAQRQAKKAVAGGNMVTPLYAAPTHDSAPVTEPHMHSDDYTPTQPQSSLHELADGWQEDEPGAEIDYHETNYWAGRSHARFECAAELQAALSTQPPTAELLALPDKWRVDELSELEREVATANALVLLETGSVKQEDGWLRMEGATRGVQALRHEPDIRYLELRGLLERHPDNPDLVRLKPAPPQEGEQMGFLESLDEYHASHDCDHGPCECLCGCNKDRGCKHPFGPYCTQCLMNYSRGYNDVCGPNPPTEDKD